MSMSINVLLLRDKNNERHQKNLKVLEACKEAEVPLPDRIAKYFGEDENPDFPLEIEFEPREWRSEKGYDEEGYEIDIDSLPEGVKTIRFYMS